MTTTSLVSFWEDIDDLESCLSTDTRPRATEDGVVDGDVSFSDIDVAGEGESGRTTVTEKGSCSTMPFSALSIAEGGRAMTNKAEALREKDVT